MYQAWCYGIFFFLVLIIALWGRQFYYPHLFPDDETEDLIEVKQFVQNHIANNGRTRI